MSVPGIVQSALGDEQVAAQVALGGEDELYVTPSRILVYRGEGLLSDETIEEYAHRAERVVVNRGRRKAKIALEHELDGDRSFSVPPSRLEDVLHPVLAGVLSAAGVTDPGETVKQTYRFSELTLILTSKRLVKHIGNAVWDQDYEEYRFEDTTGLDFEEGSVATQIVLEVDDRRERIKAPNDEAPEVRARLEDALFEFYDVANLEEFRAAVAEAEGEASGSAPDPEESANDGAVAFESGLSPLSTDIDDEGGEDDGADAPTAAEAFGESGVGGGDGVDGTATERTDEGTVSGGDAAAGAAGGQPDAATGQPDTATGQVDGTTGQIDAAAEDPTVDPGTTGGTPDTASATRETTAAGRAPGAGEAPVDDASVEPGRDQLDDEELARRLDEIARSVNKQNELLKRHQQTMEKLVDELQRMND